MQHLTLKTHLPLVRKAYEEKRLAAQVAPIDPANKSAGCVYRVAGTTNCGCAIGVGLTDETIEKIMAGNMNGNGLHKLVDSVVVTVEHNQFIRFDELQSAHDTWVRNRNSTFEAAFVKTLEELEAEFV